MRRFSVAVLALILGNSFVMMAQATTAKGDTIRTSPDRARGVNLSGKVSKDGKMFLADDDNTWIVNNVDALKGLEGRWVTVNCRMDLTKRAIHVQDVLERRLIKYTDPAFRR